MSDEDLVRRIVDEVLSRLNNASFLPSAAASGYRWVMVAITGATIGTQAALEGLARLKEQRGDTLDYIVLFSRAAAEIHKPEEVGKKIRAAEVLVEGKNAHGRAAAALKACSLVAVPALSRNTAARTALLIIDSLVPEVMVDALMRGLPVVAAKDAADPTGVGYVRLGMSRSNPALIKTMAENLDQIAGYGVTLVPAAALAPVLEQRLWGQAGREAAVQPPLPVLGKPLRPVDLKAAPEEVPGMGSFGNFSERQPGRRVIVTRTELDALVGSDGIVRVSKGAVITPLVWDIIRDAGWRVEEV